MDRLETVRQFFKAVERMNNLNKTLQNNAKLMEEMKKTYGIRNSETFERLLSVSNMMRFAPHTKLSDQLRYIDTMITISKEPELFSKALSYSTFLTTITSKFDKQFVNELNENIQDNEEENGSNEDDEDFGEVVIKRPVFYNLAFNINLVINTTDNEISEKQNISENEKTTWEKRTKPILNWIAQIFLAWALSDTPIQESNIYKTFEPLVNYIEEIFEDEEPPNHLDGNEIILAHDDN
ncbi:hypothetical protein [Peribacillus butanolivorans]